MEMTRFEKWLVNRNKKSERNIARVRERLAELPLETIKNVLELGCGIGGVAAFLSENYDMRVWGTDYDGDQIKIARKQHPENEHLTYRVEDATKLSFGGASFELVVSQNVFHHLSPWQSAVSEIARVLGPGGYLLWLDLTFFGWMARLFQPLTKRHSLFSIRDVKQIFQKFGFEQLFHERRFHGLFAQQHMVWKKSEAK